MVKMKSKLATYFADTDIQLKQYNRDILELSSMVNQSITSGNKGKSLEATVFSL